MREYIAYVITTIGNSMTEQEITVKECLQIIRSQRSFGIVRTTYDHMIACGVQEAIAEAIEVYYGLKPERKD